MTVLLTISESLNGAAVGDTLAGGGTGIDLGAVINNQFAPIIDKSANTGAQTLYIRHDATIDPITDVGFYVQVYGSGTGFTYGGADSAANDFATLFGATGLGHSSGSSKNNADGLSGGLWLDMDADATTGNQFDQATFPTLVKIFGDNSGVDGIDLLSAFGLVTDALVYDAPGETLATTPVAGQIGKANDTVLGDNAKIKLRIYLPNAFANGGIVQTEMVVKYSFTA